MSTKKTIILFAGLAAIVSATYFGFGSASKENLAVAQDSKWKTNSQVDMSSDKAKLGYTFGAQMASQLVTSGLVDEIELEEELVIYRDLAVMPTTNPDGDVVLVEFFDYLKNQKHY